jgi:hypothetical protein
MKNQENQRNCVSVGAGAGQRFCVKRECQLRKLPFAFWIAVVFLILDLPKIKGLF